METVNSVPYFKPQDSLVKGDFERQIFLPVGVLLRGPRQRSTMLATMRAKMRWILLLAFAMAANSGADDFKSSSVGNSSIAFLAEDQNNATNEETIQDLHILNSSRAELREYLGNMPLLPLAKDCRQWSETDSRVGMLIPVTEAARLIIGEPPARRGKGKMGVSQIEKNYEVTSFSKGGSPITGNAVVRITAAELKAERDCLRKLVGVPIQWPLDDSEPNSSDEILNLTIDEVLYKRAARLDKEGQKVPTGDYAVSITMTEGRVSMLFREMRANTWGIVAGVIGGALLMALTYLGRRVKRVMPEMLGKLSAIPRWLSARREERKRLEGEGLSDGVGESKSSEKPNSAP